MQLYAHINWKYTYVIRFITEPVVTCSKLTRETPEECVKCSKLKVKTLELEAATRGGLCKKVFLEISQNSQENTYARVSVLIKLQRLHFD